MLYSKIDSGTLGGRGVPGQCVPTHVKDTEIWDTGIKRKPKTAPRIYVVRLNEIRTICKIYIFGIHLGTQYLKNDFSKLKSFLFHSLI